MILYTAKLLSPNMYASSQFYLKTPVMLNREATVFQCILYIEKVLLVGLD